LGFCRTFRVSLLSYYNDGATNILSASRLLYPSSNLFVLELFIYMCTLLDIRIVEKHMRRTSIGEVGVYLEHVLFMPMEPSRNLIIVSFIRFLLYLPVFSDVMTSSTSDPMQSWHHPFVPNTAYEDLHSKFRELSCLIFLFMYRVDSLGTGWTDHPTRLLLFTLVHRTGGSM
jgi:hypothetical protein